MGLPTGDVATWASVVVVGAGMVVQGVVFMLIREREKGGIQTRSKLMEERYLSELKSHTEATEKLEKTLKELGDSYKDHVRSDDKFQTKITTTLESVGKAMETVARHTVDIAVVDQRLNAYKDAFAQIATQFERVGDRFEESFRAIYELARGEHFTAEPPAVVKPSRRRAGGANV